MGSDATAGAVQWMPTLQHELPGRLRVRIPALRGDAAAARRAVGAALLCAGVRQADANPATGSLLVEFDLFLQDQALAGLGHTERRLHHADGAFGQ